MTKPLSLLALAVLGVVFAPLRGDAANAPNADVRTIVSRAIRPMMQRYGIAGMAVGVAVGGRTYVYNYGVASTATGRPVTNATLFEIGSVTKTFTATLASYAQVTGKLSLSDAASAGLPPLRGSAFDGVSLLELGTHTAGGLPLQVPDGITNDGQLTAYLRQWKPPYKPGAYRVYSNVGIGLLGVIAAERMGGDFAALMQARVFDPLGLKNTFLTVAPAQMKNYAQGYTSSGTPIRMTPGVLGMQAYGIRTTAGDLLRFLQANMDAIPLGGTLQRAIDDTHTGYYRIGAMTQDLIWEQYRYPVTLANLLEGNSAKILFQANPATAIVPPSPPQDDALLNKTGSTNGFAAYVAFVPAQRIGIVVLANKSLPIAARIEAAYNILTHLPK
ncbi:MAG TPA: class C beta-lactamase [Verrucomicrobiae bacterium]|nr:class C beta-lactamase [Verrucomicrobiae bacterium]